MKKLLLLLFPVVVVTLIALLYINTETFNEKNIEGIQLGEQNLDLSDHQVQALKDILLRIEDQPEDQTSQILKTLPLTLEKKFGDDLKFEVYLDDDYKKVQLHSMIHNKTYMIQGDLVPWLYMLDDADSIYTYTNIPEVNVSYNNRMIEANQEINWSYELGDGNWYEETYKSSSDLVIEEHDNLKSFSLLSDRGFESMITNVYYEDELVFTGQLKDFGFEDEGFYDIEFLITWADAHYSGQGRVMVQVHYDVPVQLEMSKSVIEQGESTILYLSYVNDPESIMLNQDYMENLSFSKVSHQYVCVIPSTYYTTPGQYDLTVTVDNTSFDHSFEVVSRDFELQFLTVDERTTQATQTAEAYAEYNKYYKGALKEDIHIASNDLKEFPFILPAIGRLTTEFGVNRYVNNKPTSYHHAGWDIANEIGTDVIAAGEGTVVLSMYLQVTGNSIVISHGNGLFTTYFHLNERLVEAGEQVTSGQLIGKMGTTGFSTGSHLHFSVSFYAMNLEPGYFIYGERITYTNYENYFREE